MGINQNRLHNVRNPHQGSNKKVLCICSAGLLRSPTAALVLSMPPFNFNTRAVGIVAEIALIPCDLIHLEWADEIVVMEDRHMKIIRDSGCAKPIVVLHIEDEYAYRDPRLMELIAERYEDSANKHTVAAVQ